MSVWETLRKQKGLTIPVSASLGAARFPEQGQQFDQLWYHADQALYQAKRSSASGAAFRRKRGTLEWIVEKQST